MQTCILWVIFLKGWLSVVPRQGESMILYQGESCFCNRVLEDLVVQDSYVFLFQIFLFQILGPFVLSQGHEFSRGIFQGIINPTFICNCYFSYKIHSLIFITLCLLASEDKGLFKYWGNRPLAFTPRFELIVPWYDLLICFLHHFDGANNTQTSSQVSSLPLSPSLSQPRDVA